MRVVRAAALAVMINTGSLAAQAPITPGQPPPQVVPPAQDPAQPGQQTPAAPGQPPVPGQPAGAAVAPPVPQTRTFTTKTGMLFNTVRPERVKDFETVLGYLQQALDKATDPTVRAQAQGWRTFKATEPGPNASVVYVFVLDPAVPGADYGLGRILADAFPEQIDEIWKLYQGSVTGGGSLMNLAPVEPMAQAPTAAPTAPPTAPPATAPAR
jgi:hypothetical protein